MQTFGHVGAVAHHERSRPATNGHSGMPAEGRRKVIAELTSRGWTSERLAESLGISQAVIDTDILELGLQVHDESAEARDEAERLLADAQDAAVRFTAAAQAEADKLIFDAKAAADDLIGEAKRLAEAITTEARNRADASLSYVQHRTETELREAQEKAAALKAAGEREYAEMMRVIAQQRAELESEPASATKSHTGALLEVYAGSTDGLTSPEAADLAGISPYAASKRIPELRKKGFLRPVTDEDGHPVTRNRAAVHIITEAGHTELKWTLMLDSRCAACGQQFTDTDTLTDTLPTTHTTCPN